MNINTTETHHEHTTSISSINTPDTNINLKAQTRSNTTTIFPFKPKTKSLQQRKMCFSAKNPQALLTVQ
jgi:hypothetical protein